MTDAPERIWLSVDRKGKIDSCPDAHVEPCPEVLGAYVEYTRARPMTVAEAKIAALVEALRLADAALSGANMNMAVVERKVSAAIAAAEGLE